MTTGLVRREGTQDSLAGRAEVEPVLIQGPGVSNPTPLRAPDMSMQTRIADQLAEWSGNHIQAGLNKQHEKDILDGQMAYQQGVAMDDAQMAGNKWALEGYRLMDAQMLSSSLFAAQREKIAMSDHALSPDEYRAQYTARLDAALEGVDPETAKLVREQMATQMPDLVADHTAQHLTYQEGKNYESLERSIDVISRDPTATAQLVDFARGGEYSPSAGLSDDRRKAATVDGVIRALENDNPIAYSVLAKEGLLGDNLTTDQQNKIRSAQDAFEQRRRTEYNADLFAKEQNLLRRVERGEISPTDAVEEQAIMFAEHGIKMTNADAGSLYSEALNTERTVNRTAAVNFDEARARGDWRSMAKITEPILVQIESGGDPNAVSAVGAKGLMQVMDGTNTDPGFGIRPAADNSAAERVRVGQEYWATMIGGKAAHGMLKWEAGDLEAASIAYNAGPGVANKWIESGRDDSVLPTETVTYKANMVKGLQGWVAPTAQDTLAIARDRLAMTRERLALDTYEQMQPGLASLDDQYARGDIDRTGWKAGRDALYGQYKTARTKADVDHEIATTRSVDKAVEDAAKKSTDLAYKGRLEQAQAQLVEPRLAWEKVINDPASTPEMIGAATRAYAEKRGQVFNEQQIIATDRGNADAVNVMLTKATEAIERNRVYREEQVEIDSATAGGYLSKLPKNLQSRAFEQNEKEVLKAYNDAVATGQMTPEQANAAIAEDMNAFYASAGVVDPKVAMRMTAAMLGPMIDNDGNPNPQIVDTITQYAQVKAMNPRAADTMLDPEALVKAEAALSRASDPSLIPDAVRNIGLEMANSPVIKDTVEYLARPDVQSAIDREVTNYLNTRDIGWLQGMWQEDAFRDQRFDNSRSATNRIWSEENSKLLHSEIADETARLQKITPGIKPRDLVAKATENVQRRTEIIGGDIVMLGRGKDIAQQFFGDRAQEFIHDGAVNSAVMEWLRSPEAQQQYSFLSGTTAAEMLPGWVQGAVDAIVGVAGFDFEPAISTLDAISAGNTGVRPFRAFPTPRGEVAIQVLKPDGNYSEAIIIPAREAGEMYMKRRRQEMTR